MQSVIPFVFACLAAFAQQPGTLTGSVEDQDGAAIPKAKLTLTVPSGEERKATTDGDGTFQFTELPPGDYKLKAKAEGFETVKKDVKIAEKPVKLKFKLSIQAKSEQLTVTSERPELATAPGENADVVKFEEKTLRELPAEGQNILPVLSNFLSPASQGSMGPSVVVDGVEGSSLDIPTWAIKRIRVNKNPYSVQYRRPGSSRIEVTSRDGDREDFHGGIAVFARNAVLDARNAFAAVRPDLSKRMIEGRLMGPLPGRKASFFVSGERLTDDTYATINARDLSGPLVSTFPAANERTTALGRLDLRPTQMHTMNLRYLFVDEGEEGKGVGGFKLPSQAISGRESEHSVQFSDRHIFVSNFINDFRVSLERGTERTGGPALSPAIIVHGAFTGGPSANFRTGRETTIKIQNGSTMYRGIHTLRFGGQFRPRYITANYASNLAGTFEFSSLADFQAGRAFAFRQNVGDPRVEFTQHEAFTFFQDELKLRPNLNLTLGLRQEWNANVERGNRVAPRVAVAYAPDKDKTVIRAGIGVFFEDYPKLITQRSLLFDGVRLREQVVSNPTYPGPLDSALASPVSILRPSPGITLPYLTQASFSVEREIYRRTQVTVEYQTLRGVHLYRSRNVNAPLNGSRPDPSFLNINQVESTGLMRGHTMNLSLRWGTRKRLSGTAQYSLSRTFDNTNGIFGLPANSYDLHPEWGRADFDRRHRFSLLGTGELPGRFRIGTVLTIASGAPYDITTGLDTNGDTVAAERPLGMTRNQGFGPGLARIDLRLTRHFDVRRLHKKAKRNSNNLELSLDAFNALNRVNYSNFVGVETSPFFGRANAALTPRTLQLSAKYSF